LKLRILIPAICLPRLELKKEISSLAASFIILGKLHRLTASLLLLVMMVPALAPFALAGSAASEGMHCQRRPLTDAKPDASHPAPSAAMHCHHTASQAAAVNSKSVAISPSTAHFLRASDCCCNQQCDCCRNSKTSTWARPAFNHLAVLSLIIEPAQSATNSSCVSAIFLALDSARAPPLV